MTSPGLMRASAEKAATEQELAARIKDFEAAVFRGDGARLAVATEAAHAALQSHLDATAAVWAVARRDFRP